VSDSWSNGDTFARRRLLPCTEERNLPKKKRRHSIESYDVICVPGTDLSTICRPSSHRDRQSDLPSWQQGSVETNQLRRQFRPSACANITNHYGILRSASRPTKICSQRGSTVHLISCISGPSNQFAPKLCCRSWVPSAGLLANVDKCVTILAYGDDV
jgi:hypothetical protein